MTSSYPLDSNDKESRFSHGITKFNIKPRDGIQYLQRQELIGSTPIEVAEFLCSRRLFRGRSTLQSGLNKRKIGEYLGYYGGKSEVEIQYHCNLLAEYLKHTPMEGVDLDVGLRRWLETFVLPGEAQMIDRMVQAFAAWYHVSNLGTFRHQDTAHVLAFAVIMLHTDAHNKQIKKKMTEAQFVKMMRGIDQGTDLNATMLSNVYHRTITKKFALDHHEHGVVTFFNANREGWLWKCGSNSQKRWKKRWFLINNHCLYYFKTKPEVGLDNTLSCRCVIPLEDLTVKLKSNGKFNIRAAREGARLKTAKRNNKGTLIQGSHTKITFRAESSETAKQWVDDIQVEMTPNPFLFHMQRLAAGQNENLKSVQEMKTDGSDGESGGGSISREHEKKEIEKECRSSEDNDYMRDDGQLMTDSELETDDEHDFDSGNKGMLDFYQSNDESSDPEGNDSEESFARKVTKREDTTNELEEEKKKEEKEEEEEEEKKEEKKEAGREEKKEAGREEEEEEVEKQEEEKQEEEKQEEEKQEEKKKEEESTEETEEKIQTTAKRTETIDSEEVGQSEDQINGGTISSTQVHTTQPTNNFPDLVSSEDGATDDDSEIAHINMFQVKEGSKAETRVSPDTDNGRSPTLSMSDDTTPLSVGKTNSSSSIVSEGSFL